MVITGGRSEGLAKDGGLRPEAKKTRQSLRLLASPRFSSFSLLDPLYLKEVAKMVDGSRLSPALSCRIVW